MTCASSLKSSEIVISKRLQNSKMLTKNIAKRNRSFLLKLKSKSERPFFID